MAKASRRFTCEAAGREKCDFAEKSEQKEELVDAAKRHTRDKHGKELSEEEILRASKTLEHEKSVERGLRRSRSIGGPGYGEQVRMQGVGCLPRHGGYTTARSRSRAVTSPRSSRRFRDTSRDSTTGSLSRDEIIGEL